MDLGRVLKYALVALMMLWGIYVLAELVLVRQQLDRIIYQLRVWEDSAFDGEHSDIPIMQEIAEEWAPFA